jgi:hypothetical protein
LDPGLEKFVAFLERNKIRATYAAVAEAADVPPRSVGGLLGDRSQRASWVVNASTGEPTGYAENEEHPDLRVNKEIIRTGDDLIRRMKKER